MVIDGKTQHSKDVNSSKLFYRFNAVLIRIPASFFLKMHTDKIIIQFRWKDKRITKNNFEKKKSRRTHSTQVQDVLYSYNN